MIKCPECNIENSDGTQMCLQCGQELLTYDSICGMPMLAGSCRDQVLNMRYIVDNMLSTNDSGCIYQAEDAFDGRNVVIWALSLSQKLSNQQISNLQSSVKGSYSLFSDGFIGPKDFDVCGQVRYFVYNQTALSDNDKSEIEQIKHQTEAILESQTAENNKLKTQLNQYREEIQSLKDKISYNQQAHDQLMQQAAHQQKQTDNTIDQLKGIIEIQKTRLQVTQSSFDHKINTLQEQLETQRKSDSDSITQAMQQIELLQRQKQNAEKLVQEQCSSYELKLSELQASFDSTKADLQQQLNTESVYRTQLQNDKFALDKQIEELSDRLKRSEAEIDNLSDCLRRASEENVQIRQQYEDARSQKDAQIDSLHQQLSATQQQYESILEQSKAEICDLSENLKQKINEQEILQKDSHSHAAALQAEIESLHRKIENIQEQARQTSEQSQREIAILSDKLYHQLRENTVLENQLKQDAVEYTSKTDGLNNQIAEIKQQYIDELNHAKWKIDALTKSLAQSETKFNELTENNRVLHAEAMDALKKESEQQKIIYTDKINQIKAETERQKAQYAKQSDNARWKIKALSVELEKHIGTQEKSTKFSGVLLPGFKFPVAATVTAIAAGLIVGIGITHSLHSLHRKQLSWEQQQIIALNTARMESLKQDNTMSKSQYPDSDIDMNDSVFEKEIQRLDKFYSSKLTQETARVYLKAAQKGDVDAMYKLGMAYLEGIGTDIHPLKAVAWLSRAAENGIPEADLEIGNLFYAGDVIEKNRDKARQHYLHAAEEGNAMAMYNIGKMYQEDAGTLAVQWYEKAAENGLPKAMNQLAQMYYIGTIVPQDLQKTVEYYEMSAQHDDTKAMYNLASLYQSGVGVEKDIRTAMLWLIKAARQGDADSMYQLGTLFENGTVIQQDIEKALYWYQTASEKGHQKAPQKLIELKKTS